MRRRFQRCLYVLYEEVLLLPNEDVQVLLKVGDVQLNLLLLEWVQVCFLPLSDDVQVLLKTGEVQLNLLLL